MRIDFECSGGYANLELAYRVETTELPPELASELESAVEGSCLLDLDEQALAPGPSRFPDAISYRLFVQDGDRSRTAAVDDITAPEALRTLLARLRQLALQQRIGEGRTKRANRSLNDGSGTE